MPAGDVPVNRRGQLVDSLSRPLDGLFRPHLGVNEGGDLPVDILGPPPGLPFHLRRRVLRPDLSADERGELFVQLLSPLVVCREALARSLREPHEQVLYLRDPLRGLRLLLRHELFESL